MNFHIDFQAFLKTLPVMLNGMIGGMVVMGLICLIILALYKFGQRSSRDKKA